MSPFNVVRDSSITTGFGIREIAAVPAQNAADQYANAAVGVTDKGALFYVREHRVQLLDEPREVTRLLMARSGRFLYVLSGNRLVAFRNPAIAQSTCRVEVAELAGSLAVGGYKRVAITIRNTGAIPIHHFKARLQSDTVIDPAVTTRQPPLPLSPGQTAELEFSVKALVAGDAVPITLHIELADEGGPPFTTDDLSLNMEAR